jgi:WD40 repeat protein
MSRLAVVVALALATTAAAQHTAKVHAIAYSPGGKLLVSGGEDGRLVTWEASTGDKVAETRVGRSPWAIRDVAFAGPGPSSPAWT